MKKIISLPTWILLIIFKPFLPTGHLLKDRKITLLDWHQNGTELLIMFDIFFWVFIFFILIFFIYLN